MMVRRRHDPRAERAAHAVAGRARPRFDLWSVAPPQERRRRRDPRAERHARQVAEKPSGRPRFDALRADAASVRPAAPDLAPAVEAARAAPTTIVVEAPAFYVLVVPGAAHGRLSPHDRQLLAAGRILAGTEGAVAALAPPDCADLGAAGADRRVVASPVPPSSYDPDAWAHDVVATMSALSPRHVLFAETGEGGDLARRVAVLTGELLFTDADGLSPQRLRRSARNRRIEQSAAPPKLITVAPDTVAAYAGAPREARLLEGVREKADYPPTTSIVDAQWIPADPAIVPLAAADFVAAAGNGITDFATFHQLVAALAATPGASRVLCDAGLMPRDRQVGASGTVLAATCYLALGIAGAPQHLQGVADCEHVVAVNTDLHAAMIERADLAIVQDAQLVMPALLAELAREAEAAA